MSEPTPESTPASTAFVPYSDDVEQIQPNEAEDTDAIIASFDRMRVKAFEKHRHAVRDAHAKSHGALKGELTVYNNTGEAYRQGIFREAKTYPVILRFSTAPGDIVSDGISSFRGLAVKVVGVPGKKVLPIDPDALTQDFLMVTHPVIPTGDVASYLKEQLRDEKKAAAPEQVQEAVTTALRTVNRVTSAVGLPIPPADNGQSYPEYHPLGDTYFSMAAIRYGDYIAKISVAPSSENVRALAKQTVKIDSPASLRDAIVDFFRENSAEYELRAQLCTNLERMPVEDGSVEWPESESPYVPVARLTIPAQEAYSPARRVFIDDVLTFNPWHCIPEHRPLGSIMRVRMKAYEASTQYRHKMNAQPLKEPRSIDELPD